MNWGVLFVLLVIPLGVWVLSNLIRRGEEERPGERQRPGGRDMGQGRTRPASTDIDRFLEEINRRRRDAAQRQTSPQQAPPPPPRPVPVARAQAPRRRPGTPSPARVPRARPSRQVQEVIEIGIQEVSSPTVPPVDASPSQAPAPVAAKVARPQAPALVPTMALLRSRQGLATAVMVQEILRPPVCLRRRRK